MIARFSAESRQILPAAAGVIPAFAKKRLRQKSSGRHSRRSRTLPAFLLLLAVACGRPASYEKFVRADEAAGGVYEFYPEMSDTTASYDLSFYTAPLSEPLHLEIIWNSQHQETVWFPAGKHRALYRSGIRAGSDTPEMQLRVRPLNAPGDFRGLGIIMHQNDGTR